MIVFVIVSDPPSLDAVSVTSNWPGVEKGCVGFCTVEVAPSPKSHSQSVASPVDESVKTTTLFTGTMALGKSKSATGGSTGGG